MIFYVGIIVLQYDSQNGKVPMGPKQPGPTVYPLKDEYSEYSESSRGFHFISFFQLHCSTFHRDESRDSPTSQYCSMEQTWNAWGLCKSIQKPHKRHYLLAQQAS